MIKIGDTIRDTEFDAFTEGEIKKISTGDYLGKWLVLIFYPADFSFVCPTELEEAAKHYDEFKELGAEVISVSTDTAYSHMAWHDTSPSIAKIKYPMAADPAARLSKEFGTYVEDTGMSLRGTFIVDPDGVLKTIEIHDNSIGRNIVETLRKLKAAVHVREFPGEVCPVNWEPGKKTLKPGADLVGKI
ncbi:MAG: redoxin domain-containing protein [Candidatus Micrarchaeaceae archaeon]|jgi:peroxiredoxin (alkyl hydroperoxide reductase subunit C)